MSDLNSLFHGALKVAELTKFPMEKVCLVYEESQYGDSPSGDSCYEHSRAGVEFANAGLFILMEPGGLFKVAMDDTKEMMLVQPMDKMLGLYNNLTLALSAAAMIISGCDQWEVLRDTAMRHQHDATLPPFGA